ncbi:uncharacterized protein LOC131311852 [Rhododendron vialii]|uniref:uncharacterized protein LOC131311852 n=1 Tax=Rhododendron vialii TaxID=182163 RepID=UPI00265F92FB|nr:uncharacterized protein LOC131311852 [Rhododendron vialii]
MASELPNCLSSSTGIDALDELDATEIDESLLRDLLEELEEDEEVKNDQNSCSTCAVQPTEATAMETVHPGMLGCDEFSEQITRSHVHDSLWLDIMEMDPPSPMIMNEMMTTMWYGESCVEEGIGGGMVDFGGNGSEESHLYHHGALSIDNYETPYGFLWQHDNFPTAKLLYGPDCATQTSRGASAAMAPTCILLGTHLMEN